MLFYCLLFITATLVKPTANVNAAKPNIAKPVGFNAPKVVPKLVRSNSVDSLRVKSPSLNSFNTKSQSIHAKSNWAKLQNHFKSGKLKKLEPKTQGSNWAKLQNHFKSGKLKKLQTEQTLEPKKKKSHTLRNIGIAMAVTSAVGAIGGLIYANSGSQNTTEDDITLNGSSAVNNNDGTTTTGGMVVRNSDGILLSSGDSKESTRNLELKSKDTVKNESKSNQMSPPVGTQIGNSDADSEKEGNEVST